MDLFEAVKQFDFDKIVDYVEDKTDDLKEEVDEIVEDLKESAEDLKEEVAEISDNVKKALTDFVDKLDDSFKLELAGTFVAKYLDDFQKMFAANNGEVDAVKLAAVTQTSSTSLGEDIVQMLGTMPKADIIMRAVKKHGLFSLPTLFLCGLTNFSSRYGKEGMQIAKKVDDDLIRESAVIAKHVYGDLSVPLIGGWQESALQVPDVVFTDDTGLNSKLYERQTVTQKEYIYATAGTDMDDIKDWVANVTQVLGSSNQYENALRNATLISDKVGDAKLTFVGHSLGGGEAAYNALKLPNRRAITFNPAGVSPIGNVKGYYGTELNNIDAFITMNDPLNIMQDILDFIPSSDGMRHYLKPVATNESGHSIATIIKSIEVL